MAQDARPAAILLRKTLQLQEIVAVGLVEPRAPSAAPPARAHWASTRGLNSQIGVRRAGSLRPRARSIDWPKLQRRHETSPADDHRFTSWRAACSRGAFPACAKSTSAVLRLCSSSKLQAPATPPAVASASSTGRRCGARRSRVLTTLRGVRWLRSDGSGAPRSGLHASGRDSSWRGRVPPGRSTRR
jgi:hypothetical protein